MNDQHIDVCAKVVHALGLDGDDFAYRLRAGIGSGLQREIQYALTDLSVKHKAWYPDPENCIWVNAQDAERAEMIAVRVENRSQTWEYVLRLAVLMEHKFSLNRHKGDREGWLKMGVDEIDAKLGAELIEMMSALFDWKTNPTPENARAVALEAADVANYCVELADRVGGL